MIEINLIPDVKQELLHAQRVRNAAITISIMVGAAAVGVVVLLGLALGALKLNETIVRGSIKSENSKLQETENINEVLTMQNQLSKISDMHANKSMQSRLFTLLPAFNPPEPNSVKISNLMLDPEESTIRMEGSAVAGYPALETFRKTILNTKLEQVTNGDKESIPLTNEVSVIETSYGESSDGNRVLRFTISFEYPKELFVNTGSSMTIVTPTSKTDVTDSRTRVPESLFSQQPSDVGGDN